MARSNINFTGGNGQALSAILDAPSGRTRAFALFAHCFTCSKNLKAAANIARTLRDQGIAVLRFDFTGLGDSEGEFSDTNFSGNVDDILAAADYLDKHHTAPSLLIGHSLGGTAILRAASRIPGTVAVATIGSPSQPSHVAALLDGGRKEIERAGSATVQLGGRPFTIKKQFLDDLDEHNLSLEIGSLGKALLVMHAPLDDIVSIDNASELFLQAKHPKSFVSLDDADHLLSRKQDARYAARVLAAWVSRFLPDAAAAPELPASDGIETVARTANEGFRTDIVSAGHRLVADEPATHGGTNQGPTPYGLLASALASCTTMTLQLYARRKKLDLQSAVVRINHEKTHAEDCADCETGAGKVDVFHKKLILQGNLSAAERQRLAEIADMCPVHRTLHSEVKVITSLADLPD